MASSYRSGMYIAGMVLCLCAVICNVISFTTPYWIQSWTKVHTPFKRMGLWQVCFNGYRNEKILWNRGHYGCWWIQSTQLDDVDEWIKPIWFKIVQALSVFVVLLNMGTWWMLLIDFFRCCRAADYLRIVLAAIIMLFLSAFLNAISIVLFGAKSMERYWLPSPEHNYLSWSFGFVIITWFFSVFSASALLVEYKTMKRLVKYREAAEAAEDAVRADYR